MHLPLSALLRLLVCLETVKLTTYGVHTSDFTPVWTISPRAAADMVGLGLGEVDRAGRG